MKVFTEDNQRDFFRHNIKKNLMAVICSRDELKNNERCKFKSLIYYIIDNFFDDYNDNDNEIEIEFYISSINIDEKHAIKPILLRIVTEKNNIINGKIYKIQDEITEDITDKSLINVTLSNGQQAERGVIFFNAILIDNPEEQDELNSVDVEQDELNSVDVEQVPMGGKLKKKGQKKKTSKKPAVSQNKENKYKDVLGKRMKIYKKPDSRKEFVRYKGELVALVEFKKSMKEIAKNKNAKK